MIHLTADNTLNTEKPIGVRTSWLVWPDVDKLTVGMLRRVGMAVRTALYALEAERVLECLTLDEGYRQRRHPIVTSGDFWSFELMT